MAPYDRPKESLAIANRLLFKEAITEFNNTSGIASQLEPLLLPHTEEETLMKSGSKNADQMQDGRWRIEWLYVFAIVCLLCSLFAWFHRKEIVSRLRRSPGTGWYSLEEIRFPA